MLTGYLPFEAGNPLTVRSKILKASFTDPAILVPEISTILQEVIEKTLRVNPIQRISAVELNRFLKGQSAKKTMSKMPSFTKLFSIPGFSSFQLSKLVSRNSILYLGVTALLIVLITLFVLNNSAETDSKVKGESTHEVPGNNKKIKINVPSVENAVIVLSDGTEKKAPHEISGKAGERVEFTVRANGYADKKITIEITDRRGSYDINLEKLNQ